MPKHVIVYNLPEENEELKTTMQATSISCALWEFAHQYLRNRLKHEDMTEEQWEFLDKVKDDFWEILEKHDVILE